MKSYIVKENHIGSAVSEIILKMKLLKISWKQTQLLTYNSLNKEKYIIKICISDIIRLGMIDKKEIG